MTQFLIGRFRESFFKDATRDGSAAEHHVIMPSCGKCIVIQVVHSSSYCISTMGTIATVATDPREHGEKKCVIERRRASLCRNMRRGPMSLSFRNSSPPPPPPHERPSMSYRVETMKTSATRIQALFRGYSVRVFLRRTVSPELSGGGVGVGVGVEGGGGPPLPPRERDKETPAKRVRRDCKVRRRWERETSIAELKRLDEESSRCRTFCDMSLL